MYALLGGKQTPGLAILRGGAVPREWQEQKGSATDGNSLRYMGAPLSEFEMALRLWTPQHREDWIVFRPMVNKPKPGVQPPAYDIVHPLTEDIEVFKVVVVDRTMLAEIEPGLWETVVKLKSYKKPKPVVVSKPKSVDNAEGDPPKAETEMERKIREQDAENAAKRKALEG